MGCTCAVGGGSNSALSVFGEGDMVNSINTQCNLVAWSSNAMVVK